MMAAREKNQADFDLARFIDMFDTAMTSDDPRVVDALRSLMMIVVLTNPEAQHNVIEDRQRGPLRRLFDDVTNLNRRLNDTQEDVQRLKRDREANYAHNQDILRNTQIQDWVSDKDKYKLIATQMRTGDIDPAILNKTLYNAVSTKGKI